MAKKSARKKLPIDELKALVTHLERVVPTLLTSLGSRRIRRLVAQADNIDCGQNRALWAVKRHLLQTALTMMLRRERAELDRMRFHVNLADFKAAA